VQNVAIALAAIVLLVWTVFPFLWILLTSLKGPGDIISVPPTSCSRRQTDNYAALVMGEQSGQRASTRPTSRDSSEDMIISIGAVALSVAAGIPAGLRPGPLHFPLKGAFAFILMSFRFVPFIAFVIPLYLLYQQVGLYNTHAGLILAYQLITLPFTIWMLRSFFMEVPLEIQEAAKIDGCSWLGVLGRVILPLSMPGIAVTVILGFHVQLERVQLSADAGRPPDLPGDGRRHPVHLLRAGAVGTDGSGNDRCRLAATSAQPDGAEVHRSPAHHGRGEVSAAVRR